MLQNTGQPFELSFFPSPSYNNSFDFTSKDNFCTPRHPLPSSQPMSHSCPKKSGRSFFLRLGTWRRQNNCPWKVPKKKSTLWMSTFWIFKSWWPWKNPTKSPFLLQDLVFLYINKTSPPKSPRLVSSKDNKNAAPPSEILRRRRCRLLEHGLHSALPVALLAGYIHDEWDVHQFFFLWSWNLKGNSPPSCRFWHKLQMQKQNWFTRVQKNKQNNPPSHWESDNQHRFSIAQQLKVIINVHSNYYDHYFQAYSNILK